MSVLTLPDHGLLMESSDSGEHLPLQAFGITLNDSVIEDMIKCVQNGQKIELFLGNNPSLQYDGEEEVLKPPAESFDYDLYLTNLNESVSKAQRLPNPTMSILKRPTNVKLPKPSIRVEKVKGGKVVKTKPLPAGKSAMAMALSGSGATRSLPSSPALKGVGSPSHNYSSTATQQLIEKNKELRSTIVHELAVEDQTYDYLKERWTGSETDLKNTLGRVADEIGGKFSMKKLFWKELDVWNFNYIPPSNRQSAIENAKKQYDKQRLGATEPEWERLLEEKDRGKGIILSKLQAQLAKGNLTPAAKPPKADDTSSKNSSDESVKGKLGGEAMARSNSQPIGNKPKSKASEREAHTKKLLSTKPNTTAKKAAPVIKKAAPVSKAKPTDKGTKKFLSEEFVQDSSSEDEAPLAESQQSKPKPVEKSPIAKSIERLNEKPVEKSFKERSPAPPPAAKPKPKSVIRAPRPATSTAAPKTQTNTAQKRSREEDDSSSSSGAPLSKRVKPKETAPPAKPVSNNTSLKHRPSDASQNSRATPSNFSHKSKNTSPAKSSPLASSPPTNASDIEDNSHSGHSGHSQQQDRHRQTSAAPRANGHTNGNTPNGMAVAKKRLPESQAHTPSQQPTKKARVNKIGKDILDKAHRFDKFYERYRILHDQLTRSANPPREKLEDLIDMRERLVDLKAEIRREVETA